MDDQHWRRVEALFHECRGVAVDRRNELLDRRCAGDLRLRADVVAVLEASHHADGFIELIVQAEAQRLGRRNPDEL
jgi:hypothetical protein